jgi:hypothetical protein
VSALWYNNPVNRFVEPPFSEGDFTKWLRSLIALDAV